MKRKVIKRLTMLSLVSMFSLCAAVATANAQLSTSIKAKIPFDFTVGNKKLPAGEYTFSRLSGFSDNNVISVRGADASAHVFQSTLGAHVLTPKDKSTLVFHKYGDQYFLSQIWTPGGSTGRELLMPRLERELAKNAKIARQTIVRR